MDLVQTLNIANMADYIDPRKQGKEKMVFSYFLEKYTAKALPLATIISASAWSYLMRDKPEFNILNIIIVLLTSLGTGIIISRIYAYFIVSHAKNNRNYKTFKTSLNAKILGRLKKQGALVWPQKGDKNYPKKLDRKTEKDNILSEEIAQLEYEHRLFDDD